MSLPVVWPGSAQLIKGTLQPVKQKSILRFVKGKGWTTVDVWESATEAAAKGLAQDLALAGYTNVEVSSPDQVKWRVEASIEGQGEGSPDEPVDTWQLLSTAETVDILSHPKVVALQDDEVRTVIEAVENPKPGTSPALTSPDAIELYVRMLRGAKSFARPQYVLRHSISLPNDDAIAANAAMSGDLKIWTLNQLPAMPDGIGAAISDIGNPFATGDADSFLFGWLKQLTTISTDVFGKTTIEREWHLGNWSTWEYAPF